MNKIRALMAGAALAAGLGVGGTAHAANLLTNESFSDVAGTVAGDPDSCAGFTNGLPGFAPVDPVVNANVIAPWVVTFGNVDIICTLWQAADGDSRSIDMSGGTPGAIAQTFATSSGENYSCGLQESRKSGHCRIRWLQDRRQG